MSSAAVAMDILAQIRDAIRARSSFLLTSHARPDGDSIGSQVALAAALRALGKSVRMVNRDRPPSAFLALPGVAGIEVAPSVEGDFDALVVLECSDLSRPGVAGLEGYYTINIDHHPGNAMYGAINWFDGSAAACGEQVAAVIDALGVPWTPEIGSARLPRHPHRHRRLPPQPHHQPHLRVVPPGHRSRRRRRGAGPAGLRAEHRSAS